MKLSVKRPVCRWLGRRVRRLAGRRAVLVLLAVLGLSAPLGLGVVVAGCGSSNGGGLSEKAGVSVVADLSFLADIAQNVAGDRLEVTPLVPEGADPHSFQATPSDAGRLASADLILINVAGLIPSLDELIRGAARADVLVVEAAAGVPGAGEDPHVWLDPLNVLTYVDNILAGLTQVDPKGAETFAANAEDYKVRLRELDAWIASQVATVPPERRLLVTEHESLGYFARRYGFTVVGTVFPSVLGESAPSARHLSELVAAVRSSGAPAVFVEVGSNGELAARVAEEAGVKLVSGLRLHSLDREVSTYLDMMRLNAETIVNALL